MHCGYKMSLGYNPRSSIDWQGSRPNTRMGTNYILEKKFNELLQKREKAILKKDQSISELGDEEKVNAEMIAEALGYPREKVEEILREIVKKGEKDE